MICIKVPVKEAQNIKKELLENDLIDKDYFLKKDKDFVYFPVKKSFPSKHDFVRKILKKKKERAGLKTTLTKKLKKEDLEFLRRSMDVIGDIAILEIPRELEKKKKLIAQEVLNANKYIKTVLKKGKHEGVFRTQKLEHLAGEKTKEAIYKENNVQLKLDVEKVYFSPRLSNDRKRIAKLINKGEEILVMFSGCAPYVCVIAKNTNAKNVCGVEINPTAHNYALQNVLLNKLNNTGVFLGDVKSVVPKLAKKYDRILMPLPKNATEFLDVALNASKKGTIIHLYDFKREDELKESIEQIKQACAKAKKKCKILDTVRCGQHAPRTFRYCIEFQIL
ncbi:MAG: class I SAM-dependent methyltransferase family protein [Nanoarchaeota archaeon]|nr:class I SAM-dependent methyltransferase family protein [Nanoarchaeota archaeon]MBU1321739.1 class I SAM-dependent methyltransferase family protein [Nanoarchaeota archaeon]MBU1597705.1 class I SAM-dependent methyltransferase family protein [Nanoarchaeota archaeon]MBU2442297.1 class I SAM-dependent methyltransferase family protein [Nanoarchaeota archaeon]